MNGKGATDATFALRSLIEKQAEKRLYLFLTYLDQEKAFDRVSHHTGSSRIIVINVRPHGRWNWTERNL